MTFRPDEVDSFLRLFSENKREIRGSEGCTHLELLRDVDNANIFFTYSFWEDAQRLEQYRHSDLFKKVWPATKSLFQEPAQAWSLDREHLLP